MSPHTILHLDDDENDVLFLKHAFRQAQVQHVLHSVRDGQEAVEFLDAAARQAGIGASTLPLMSILDLKTPRKSGYEVLCWIRSHPVLRPLVVIMLTASANQRDIEKAYASGANAFMVKPAGLDRLTEMVRALDEFWFQHNRFVLRTECSQFRPA
jgi:CheY-like chemotaxis protein